MTGGIKVDQQLCEYRVSRGDELVDWLLIDYPVVGLMVFHTRSKVRPPGAK